MSLTKPFTTASLRGTKQSPTSRSTILLIALVIFFSGCARFEEKLVEIHIVKNVYLYHSEGNTRKGYNVVSKQNENMYSGLIDEEDIISVSFDSTKVFVRTSYNNRADTLYYKINIAQDTSAYHKVSRLTKQAFVKSIGECKSCKSVKF